MAVHDFTKPPAPNAPAPGPSPAAAAAVERPSTGDRAGEHTWMERGRYSAWVYVVLAFLGQVFLLMGVVGAIGAALARSAGSHEAEGVAMMVGFTVGVAGAIWTFWDHWRVIEAFSSRFCSGLANLSLLYVPIISWGYANYRFLRRLSGR